MGSVLNIADRIKASAIAARRAEQSDEHNLEVELHAREREVLETVLATGKVVLGPNDDLTAITGLDAKGNRAGPCCMYETLMHRFYAELQELNAAYTTLQEQTQNSMAQLGSTLIETAEENSTTLAGWLDSARARIASLEADLETERERTLRAAELFNGMEMFKNNLQLRLASTETSVEMMRKKEGDLNTSSASGATRSTKSMAAVAMQRKTKNRRTAIDQELAEEVSQITGARRGANFRYGYLLKREKRRKAWTKLWVTLDHSFLEYRNNKSDRDPRGRIGLDGCVVMDVPEDNALGLPDKHPNYLAFHLRLQNRKSYYFVGETISDVRDWKDAITSNITVNESLKTLVANAKSCEDPRILDSVSSQDIEMLALNHRPLGMREMVAIQIALTMADHFYALRTVSLRDASIGPSEIAIAANAFGDNPSLTALDVSNNMLGDKGIVLLCESLASSSICELAVSSNGFGNLGMEALASLLATNTSLVWLDASHNLISDGGMVSLYAACTQVRDADPGPSTPAPVVPPPRTVSRKKHRKRKTKSKSKSQATEPVPVPEPEPVSEPEPVAPTPPAPKSEASCSGDDSGAAPGSPTASLSGSGSSSDSGSSSGSSGSTSSLSDGEEQQEEEATSSTSGSGTGSGSDSDSSSGSGASSSGSGSDSGSSSGQPVVPDAKAAALEAIAATKPVHTSGFPIHSLNLSYNKIGDKGAQALAQLVSDPKATRSIARLDVRGNQIGSVGAIALADHVADSDTLLTLDISHNPVGSDGAAALVSLLERNPYLQDLDLGSLPIPVDAFCDQLRSAADVVSVSFPSLTVVRSAFEHQ